MVFDAGSHTFRVGFAGEEFPKGDIPSQVGVQEILDQVDSTVDQDAQKAAKKRKFFIGNEHLGVPRANTEIETFIKDGLSWSFFHSRYISAPNYLFVRGFKNDWKFSRELLMDFIGLR
ncbi:unnamed protein product [Toxocara canis]|uniref:Uncharacterized protein n=1 Tax=Toxocara canis TaxID=6265 RepID=A0A3P7F8A5_TOXCA|nr:unnamed protein product [Toxocara canis]